MACKALRPYCCWRRSLTMESPDHRNQEIDMKALVYHGPGSKAWEEVPMPQIIDNTDAVVRVDCTTICGSDLHILKGDVPEVDEGRILGHEAVGTVVAVGGGVTTIAPGDRVLVSCISACGRCRYCRDGRYGQCLGGGGWILGHLIDGTQAEYVRVPFADTSTYRLPTGASDEEILMLADILPTAYEVGVLNGRVQPGDTVVVVGAGPIGLSAILGARLYSPSRIVAIDLADARLEAAKSFGADSTVNSVLSAAVDRGVRTEALGGLQACVGEINGHDPARGIEPRSQDGRQADRPSPDHDDGIAGLDPSIEDAHLVGGGKDVGQHEDLLVTGPGGQPIGRGASEGHSDVLGLGTVDEVTEDPTSADQALAISTVAVVAAAPAGADARHEYSVTGGDGGHSSADRHNGAHCLMAEDPTLIDLGHVALQNVQIGSADGGA